MAKIFADSNGTIIAFSINVEFDKQYYSLGGPIGTSFTIDIDETQNLALMEDIQKNTSSYAAPLGVLNKNSTPVTIAPASTFYTILSSLSTFTETQLQAAVNSLWNGTATATQQQKSIAFILIKLRFSGLL